MKETFLAEGGKLAYREISGRERGGKKGRQSKPGVFLIFPPGPSSGPLGATDPPDSEHVPVRVQFQVVQILKPGSCLRLLAAPSMKMTHYLPDRKVPFVEMRNA